MYIAIVDVFVKKNNQKAHYLEPSSLYLTWLFGSHAHDTKDKVLNAENH